MISSNVATLYLRSFELARLEGLIVAGGSLVFGAFEVRIRPAAIAALLAY